MEIASSGTPDFRQPRDYSHLVGRGSQSFYPGDVTGGGGSLSFGGPGYGFNGTGAHGYYYDWYSGSYRTVSGGYVTPSQFVGNAIKPYYGTYKRQDAFAGSGSAMVHKGTTWRYIPASGEAANSGDRNDLLEAAGASAYWAGTINTLYGLNEEKNLAENLSRAKGYKQVTGWVPKSLRTSVNYGKATTALTKGVSRSLFGVGIVLSAVDVYQDPSASNIAWNSAIVLMGAAAFIPGMQIPALIYFTTRTAYEVYDAYNEP